MYSHVYIYSILIFKRKNNNNGTKKKIESLSTDFYKKPQK